MKRTFKVGIVGAAALSLVLTGCSAGGASSTSGAGATQSALPESVDLKGETVVSLFTSLNNDYYSGWDQGARRAVEAFNGKYVALTNEGDPATELAQFQQQIDAGAKIIFVTAPDPANVPAMAKLAQDNDVCFANTWEQPNWTSPFDTGDQYVLYQTPQSTQAAYELAKKLFDKIGGKGNVVHITGHPGATPDTQRTEGFNKALAEYPDIKLVAEEPGEWNRDDARTAMAGIISRVDKIDAVFGQNDDVGVGALNALTEAGITGVPITGMDGNASTVELIQNGQMYAVYSSLPQWTAGFSFVQALDYCKGAKVDPLNRQLWWDGIIVDADNAADYLSTYAGESDPYDWVKMSKVAYPDDWDPQNGVRPLNMEEMWSFADQPAGFSYPPEYEAALPNMDAVTQEWDDHWKLLRRD
ncbi:sugar ABC transporter substrate-binding protein [Herbiconiux daphne]|uniref:Sugar ABC transporter substrate-binding protein n=1 Tax=Herbiconiux daphne TaxID=2970914 RepID=A0ABT2H5H2_9MICO|nr:sugar ABC transporter substrate-binding protein [Herbiconiux daphne]MCS5735182.1 sugar ABC transporter substrate-binding protein [Herbiconiux daphne]